MVRDEMEQETKRVLKQTKATIDNFWIIVESRCSERCQQVNTFYIKSESL